MDEKLLVTTSRSGSPFGPPGIEGTDWIPIRVSSLLPTCVSPGVLGSFSSTGGATRGHALLGLPSVDAPQ